MGDLFGSKKKKQQAAPPAPPPIPAAVTTAPMVSAAAPTPGAPQASIEAQTAAEAEAKRLQNSVGRKATILNRKGVLGLASEWATTKKAKLGG